MPRIDSHLIPVVIDLERGLRELGIPFGILGALVPELLLDTKPTRITKDADVVVVVQSLTDFETLKDHLAEYGFARTRVPHRMRHGRGLMDIIPFSDALAPDGRLQLEEGVVFNMAGLRHVVPNAVSTPIEGGPTLPLAPLPLYVLLKLVAFSDRGAPKDLAGVLHCLEHYLEGDERRYGVEHDGLGVPFEYTCAYLLGLGARPFLDEAVSQTVTAILDGFTDPDAALVAAVAREKRQFLLEDEDRADTFERFRWYRLGTDL